jgi:hypothetical protein
MSRIVHMSRIVRMSRIVHVSRIVHMSRMIHGSRWRNLGSKVIQVRVQGDVSSKCTVIKQHDKERNDWHTVDCVG